MKAVSSWSFAPYRPPLFDVGDIYVCRIAPEQCGFVAEWLPQKEAKAYAVSYRFYKSDAPFTTVDVTEPRVRITGLAEGRDYEFFVSAGGQKSRLRLVRTGLVPGDSIVQYLHPEDGAYAYSGNALCSPSLVRHPDGYLLASMDLYKGNAPQNLTLIYRSDDEGRNWYYVTELYPCFWGKLFVHRGELYMLAVSTEYGDLLIGRSEDGGKTWGMPTVLLRGAGRPTVAGVHKNPQKLLAHKGRLWTTLEWGNWQKPYHAAMCASVPEEADLLNAENWSFSDPVPYDIAWEGVSKSSKGCIEGCMVEAPDGSLLNVMRYDTLSATPAYGKAVVMRADPDRPEAPLQFERVMDFPGNLSKFEIHFDAQSGRYFSIVSYLSPEHPVGRNQLSLITSKDLVHWELVTHIWDYSHLPAADVGFQYVNFIIENEDIILLSRTAFNGARNYHDANYQTFTRIKKFRDLLR
ncbi:MAG: exo-alpha-sialidase [Ruminococcaceae bacterium]|nr:exo-alpha-sialidase [Oscillospiraceae bacterium]